MGDNRRNKLNHESFLSKLKIEMVHNSNTEFSRPNGKEYTNQHKSKSNSLMFANSRSSKTHQHSQLWEMCKKKIVMKYAPQKNLILKRMKPSLPSHDYLI